MQIIAICYHPTIIQYCLDLQVKSATAYNEICYDEKNGQGVSYSKKLCRKHSFPNLAKGRTCQFVFRILNRVLKYKNSEIKI